MDSRDDNIYTRFKRDITNYVLNRLEEKDQRRERQTVEPQYARPIVCIETGEILTNMSAVWAKRNLREGKTATLAGKHYRYATRGEIEDKRGE